MDWHLVFGRCSARLAISIDSKTNVLPLSAYGPFGFEQWLMKLKRPNARTAFSVAF
jgi:hypothetical protein